VNIYAGHCLLSQLRCHLNVGIRECKEQGFGEWENPEQVHLHHRVLTQHSYDVVPSGAMSWQDSRRHPMVQLDRQPARESFGMDGVDWLHLSLELVYSPALNMERVVVLDI